MLGCFSLCCAAPKHRKSRKSGTIIQLADQIRRFNGARRSSVRRNQEESKKKHEEQISCRESEKVPVVIDEEQNKQTSNLKNYGYANSEKNENEQKSANQEESLSDSLFSFSIGSRSQVHAAGIDDDEVNSQRKNPREDSLLNPIENIIDTRTATNQAKKSMKSNQNINAIAQTKLQSDTDSKFTTENTSVRPDSKPNPRKRENQSNASLSSWQMDQPRNDPTASESKSNSFSNWLVDSDAGNRYRRTDSNWKKAFEDRPILGALNAYELRQISATVSPRKSPKWSHDDVPIIGSVGSYWKDSSMNSESGSSCREVSSAPTRFKEDQLVKWNSTPFEARLERALVSGVAET